MPLGTTQFFSARYHHAGPLPAHCRGAVTPPVSRVSSAGSIRDPAIESPITTHAGCILASAGTRSASNGLRSRGPSSAGR